MIVLRNKEKLLEDMAKEGLGVTGLAEKVGCSKAHISGIINYVRNPSAIIAVKICEQLKEQFDEFFFIESVHKEKQDQT